MVVLIVFALSACAADNPTTTEVISGPIVDRASFSVPKSRGRPKERSITVNGIPGEIYDTDDLNALELHQYDKIIWDSNYLTGLLEKRNADMPQRNKVDHP